MFERHGLGGSCVPIGASAPPYLLLIHPYLYLPEGRRVKRIIVPVMSSHPSTKLPKRKPAQLAGTQNEPSWRGHRLVIYLHFAAVPVRVRPNPFRSLDIAQPHE